MASHNRKYYWILLLFLQLPARTLGKVESVGTCDFEGKNDKVGNNGLCSYTHAPIGDDEDDLFNWELENDGAGNYMNVNTEDHKPGQKARFESPEIRQQDTHCFLFQYHMEGGIDSNTSKPTSSLRVYVLDDENNHLLHPVWQSTPNTGHNGWTTVQLALNPRVYQIVFEAVVIKPTPGIIALDNIEVDNEACKSASHFLRVSDKEVNVGQNVTLQCLLWGHELTKLEEGEKKKTAVVMQKSNGEELQAFQTKMYDDHMSAAFRLSNADVKKTSGRYRCISRNVTEVGVSNFAAVAVKTPPVPVQPPEVMTLSSTNLKINLNAENFAGDGPVVQQILQYKPLSDSWSDGHLVPGNSYHLWHLQPDTKYELRVVLVRPGPGGNGDPGPPLNTKTSCAVPASPVQDVKLAPIASSKIKIKWQTPDFTVTRCHFYSYVIKYRKYDPEDSVTSVSPVLQYETISVDDGNVAVIQDLTPYTMYKIKIDLINSEGSVETGDYTLRTGEGVPGPIPEDSFQVVSNNETSITLKWSPPNTTNGVLIKYELVFRGMSSLQPDLTPEEEDGLFEVRATELNVTLDNLHPGVNYTLSIRAKTEVGFGPGVEIFASTEIAPPKMPEYPSPDSQDSSSSTPTTIEINVLPAEANGAPITNYYIIIEEIPEETNAKKSSSGSPARSRSPSRSNRKRKKKRREKRNVSVIDDLVEIFRKRRQVVVNTADDSSPCDSKPLSYEESRNQNKPFYFGGQLSPDNITEGTKFTVGAGGASGGFSNPPLDPNKKYNIYVRVDSGVGNRTKVNCALVAVKTVVVPETTTTTTTTTTAITTTTTTEHVPYSEKTVTAAPGPSIVPISPGEGNGETGELEDNNIVILSASIGGGIVVFFIVIVGILILIRYRGRHSKDKRKEEVVNPFEVRMMMSDMSGGGTGRSMVRSDGSPDRQALMMPDVVGFENPTSRGMGYYYDKSADTGSSNGMPLYGSPATPIADERLALRVDDFHIHVNELKQRNNNGFHDEFRTFHDGPTAPWKVAEREENRSKNRYGNIMAYDHSRVVLDPVKGQEETLESDYINANYINGYKNPQMYIAAQAPSPETINDFWQMIWQEKSSVVVMVTNLVELGKRKCHKYWPEESEQYGSIKVSHTDTEELCDYVIRTFVIQQTDDYDVREVKQFHFTAWPDHGVPTRPTNILSFLRRVKAYEPPGQGPTTVHCSAGSGRTGCFIVIDMMLDMARDEQLVSIYNTVRDLRTRRVNMVQTEEQYMFIHDAVLEALLCGATLVPAPDLRQHYDDLITVDQNTQIAPVQEEFETLNVMTPKLTDEECSVARLPRNRQRNRFMDVLPSDSKMPYLVTADPNDPDSNYINAVFVDSYPKRDEFLVTQMPLPNTVIDYWRLIYDYNCTAMIMMNDVTEHDHTCAQYWPDNGSAVFGPFTVELLRKEDEVDIITRVFKIQNVNRPSEGFRIVQQFQLTNWPATQPVPYTRNAVLRVIQLVTKWQEECASSGEGRMLVHCVAGAGRSGTFIACYNMCIQLRQEYAVDVFNIVQRLRNIRPQLVETLEQYRFCYEVGWDFADQ